MSNVAAQSAQRPPFILFLIGVVFLYCVVGQAVKPPEPPPRFPKIHWVRTKLRNAVILAAKLAPYALYLLPLVLGGNPYAEFAPGKERTLEPTDAGVMYDMRKQGPGDTGPPTIELNHSAGW